MFCDNFCLLNYGYRSVDSIFVCKKYIFYVKMNRKRKHRPTKNNKEQLQLVISDIDNTAPVKSILDILQYQNKPAFLFYKRNRKQRKTTKIYLQNLHYVVTGYPLNKFSDDWVGDVTPEYFESFPCNSLPPRIITPLRNIEKTDPVTAYMKIKEDWLYTLQCQKKSARILRATHKYEHYNEDVIRCPKRLVDMAMHLDSDPDPYFDSSYNWYYSGNGNIQLICLNCVDYLLHSELNFLYLSQFSKENISIDINNNAIFDCGEGVNILETICSSQNIIVLRTIKKIFILKIIADDLETVNIEKIKVIESELPFTSVNFDSYHKNILYVTNLDCKLTIINMNRIKGRTVQLKCKTKSLVDNWNTVIGTEYGHYTHATMGSIGIYDKRNNNNVFMWTNVRNLTDDVTCNDISAVKQREGSSTMYFTTDHHLFLMDMRFSENFKPNIVQRWTHGMQCLPTYMSICDFEFNKELLCLSSQWCEDMCLVSNYIDRSKRSNIDGVMIPYRPTSILKTLDEARQKMLCCDLNQTPLNKRLCTAITGSLVFEQSEKYYVLMQNSLGDLTSHVLYPNHLEMFMEDDSMQQLDEWSKSFKPEQRDFEVTSILDFSDIWKRLRVPADNVWEMVSVRNKKSEFNLKEVFDAIENEEIDSGLLELWFKDQNDKTVEQSSLQIQFSDSESE